MFAICTTLYLGAWLLTAAGTYGVGRLLADPHIPVENPLLISLVAGAVWPLTILGAIELGTVAAYSKTKSMRAESEIRRWLNGRPTNDVVVQLR